MPSRLFGLLLLASAPAAAQDPVAPVPTPPPADERPGEVPGRTPTLGWTVFLGFYGGYESNIDFSTPDGPGDYGASASLAVGRTKNSPRGQISFTLDGSGILYQERTDANQLNGSARLSGSYRPASRTTLGFTATGSHQTTDVARNLIDAGLQLPRDQTTSYGGSVTLDLRPGERTKLGFGLAYSRVDFASASLVDTESAYGTFSFARKASARSDLSLSYGFLRTGQLADGFDSHYGALGWTRILSRRLSLSLASGAGYSREPQPGGPSAERWYYYGTAGLTGQIRRSTVDVQLRRSANPAYGVGGNLLSWGAALSATIPFGRRVRLSLFGVHTWSDDPLTLAASFVSDDANASLSVTFLRRLGLAVTYNYRRNEPAGAEAVTSHRGALGLTYTYSRP